MRQVWKYVIFAECYLEASSFAKIVPIMSPGDWILGFKKFRYQFSSMTRPTYLGYRRLYR